MRMKLRMGSPLKPYELYPVYEIDANALSNNSGFLESIAPSTTARGYHIHKFSVSDAQGTFFNAIDANVPRVPEGIGNIIPYRNGYSEELGGYQYLENWFDSDSWVKITDDNEPDDFTTSDQYFRIWTGTGAGIYRYIWPYLKGNTDSYDKTNCYKDLKNQISRIFYTDKGTHFGCYKGGTYDGPGLVTPEDFLVGDYPWPATGATDAAKKNYLFTDENGNILNAGLNLRDSIDINDSDTLKQRSKNIVQVFVHYNYTVTPGEGDPIHYEFYGIAYIYFPSFAEDTPPTEIAVIGLDPTFWGTSVIEGEGGQGQWTKDGVNSHVQGGQGTFSAPSDNRETTPEGASAYIDGLIDRYTANLDPLFGGYNQYVIDKNNWAPMTEMMGALWDPSLVQSYNNATMNPLTAIISCHFMPESLAPTANGNTKRIKVLGTDLSETEANLYTTPITSHDVGSVKVKSYCDGFPDFENTNIYIYLPYIGTYQLDTEAVMNGELFVKYTADSYSGDCLAWIWTKDMLGNSTFRYLFKGNCAKPMHLASVVGAGAQRIWAGLGMMVDVGANAITNHMLNKKLSNFWQPFENEEGTTTWRRADAVNPLAPIITGQAISSGVKAIFGAGAKCTQGNASTGAISVPIDTQCYLIITRPQWSAPMEYAKQFGYPSDIGGTINRSDTLGGDPFTNFLSVRSIKLEGLAATDEEKAEIESLMIAGVYVTND